MIENEQISAMFGELEVAKKRLEEAIEAKEKSARDARNIYNGISKRIDKAICELRNSAPSGTTWNDQWLHKDPEASA